MSSSSDSIVSYALFRLFLNTPVKREFEIEMESEQV